MASSVTYTDLYNYCTEKHDFKYVGGESPGLEYSDDENEIYMKVSETYFILMVPGRSYTCLGYSLSKIVDGYVFLTTLDEALEELKKIFE